MCSDALVHCEFEVDRKKHGNFEESSAEISGARVLLNVQVKFRLVMIT